MLNFLPQLIDMMSIFRVCFSFLQMERTDLLNRILNLPTNVAAMLKLINLFHRKCMCVCMCVCLILQ